MFFDENQIHLVSSQKLWIKLNEFLGKQKSQKLIFLIINSSDVTSNGQLSWVDHEALQPSLPRQNSWESWVGKFAPHTSKQQHSWVARARAQLTRTPRDWAVQLPHQTSYPNTGITLWRRGTQPQLTRTAASSASIYRFHCDAKTRVVWGRVSSRALKHREPRWACFIPCASYW